MGKTVRRNPNQPPGNTPDPVQPIRKPTPPERAPTRAPESPTPPPDDLPETPKVNPDFDPDIPEHPGPPISDPESPHGIRPDDLSVTRP
ncbi:MAG TPA: hypothetical protein VHW43_11255 [Puia sp.]|nr:hypothetical protein [Puia sp.]